MHIHMTYYEAHLFALALFVIQILFSFSTTAFTNISTDQSALLALKSQLILHPSHILSSNWSATTSVCSWIGVTCGSRHHRVTALDISGMGLVGNLPPETGNLSFLMSFNLRRNYFRGNLPQEMSRLRRLQVIDFSGNNFMGELPSWFQFLGQLKLLYLTNNSFSGLLPNSIANISKLERLDLSFNPLHGKIPRAIGNVHSLKELVLEYNQFNGVIPVEVFNISSLEILALSGNSFSGGLPADLCRGIPRLKGLYLSQNEIGGRIPSTISQCSQLRVLSLPHNKFTGTIPREIGNLSALEILYLHNNNMRGTVTENIFNMSKLENLSLSVNQLSGALPKYFGYGIPNLQYLSLWDNNFTGRIPESISNASQLVLVEVNDNSFTGPIPDSFGKLGSLQFLNLYGNEFISESREFSIITSLTNCTNLERLQLGGIPTLNGSLPATIGNFSASMQYLHLGWMNLFGRIPNEICNLSNLILLSLEGNQLTGPIPHNLTNLKRLQTLVFGGNKLSGVLPNSICELKSLAFLILLENQIQGFIPECIGQISSLRYLFIQENRLSSDIPINLWQLNNLLYLGLSSNFLTGSLPLNIGNMISLIGLDLSMNKFSSNIPNSIGNLQNLQNISLADNMFTGSIPESIGNMLSLENLNLSHNNLSGNIPYSLQSLRDLTSCDVSFNELSGQIPSNGSFKNFTSHFFASNEGLCGDPRYGVPTCPDTHRNGSKRRIFFTSVVCASLGVALLASAMTFAFIVARYRRKNVRVIQTSTQIETAPIRVSYYDIENSTEGFSESHLIGVGGFSSVYKGALRDGNPVAIKVLDLKVKGAYTNFDIECELLSSLKHRNLCKIIGVCSNENFKGLVLEYMPNGSLEKWLYSRDCFLDTMQRVSVMVDIACALEYLHHGYSVQVVHRDLKPSNVLLDENMIAHLSDFGISKLLSDRDGIAQTTTLATFGYMAPEYGSDGLVSVKCDVYSYGIMLMEVFTRMKPSSERFEGDLSLKGLMQDSWPNEIMQVIDSRLLRQDEELFEQTLECLSSIMELALKCSTEIPNLRINMKDVVVQLKKIQMKLFTYSRDNRRRRGSSTN